MKLKKPSEIDNIEQIIIEIVVVDIEILKTNQFI